MTSLVFDTHDFVRLLHETGFSEQQAEMLTKYDLKETELQLEIRIAEIQTKIAETQSELIPWVVATSFLQTALISALLLKVSFGL